VGEQPPGTMYAEAFARNEMGALVEHVVAGGPRTWVTLDPMGRITERRSSDERVERYAYHGGGRLHDVTDGAPTRHYEAGGALVGWGDVAFAYDAEARRTEERDVHTGDATRHRWDGRCLLVATELPDGDRVDHTYDAHARRLEKRLTRPDGTQRVTRFVWSGDVLIHERTTEIDATGARVVAERAYVQDDDDGVPIAHADLVRDGQRGADWTYYVLGEGDFPALLLAGDGRVLAQLRPTVWGRVDDQAARRATPLRFSGQYEDEETGLFYNRYRFYDPRVGLFVSADPIGIAGGWSAFEYAQSTPWTVVDAEGLEGVSAVVTGGGVTGTGDSKSIRQNRPVGQREPDIHPIVADSMPKPTKHGDKELYPKGAHSPKNCAEPEALSNYIREWEKKNNNGKPLDPNNPKDHAQIQKCMQDVNQVTAKQESGKGRAPCPNCSQLISNLRDKWGGPKTKAVTPGASGPNATDSVRSTPPTDKRWKKAHAKGKVR
jgi:RHS repeat-associated protein